MSLPRIAIDAMGGDEGVRVMIEGAALARRRPGQSAIVSPRKEADAFEVVSGLFEGRTLGTPGSRTPDWASTAGSGLRAASSAGFSEGVAWDSAIGCRASP